MFDKLDVIDWNKLGASEVPALLTTISSEKNQEAYVKAVIDLRHLIYPQGINDHWDWEGPARMMQNDLPHQVTPFLLNMLENTEMLPKKIAIINLLKNLCNYYHVREWISEDETDPKRKTYDEWFRRLHSTIRQGFPIYEQLLNNPDPIIQLRVRELLDSLEETSK
jgi:hypothetical protein